MALLKGIRFVYTGQAAGCAGIGSALYATTGAPIHHQGCSIPPEAGRLRALERWNLPLRNARFAPKHVYTPFAWRICGSALSRANRRGNTMETYREFDRVNFSQPEIMASLARAYAVILKSIPEPEQPVTKEAAPPAPQKAIVVARFRELFLAGLPETHSKMQHPGAKAKYYKRFHSLTDGEIASHIEGKATFAAPLIGRDGFTREVALDIDAGGEAAISTGLQIAASLGFAAYGLISQVEAGGHNGGHIRLPLADIAAPERARLLAEQLRSALMQQTGSPENTIEVYPTQKGLRLPFGVHTHTGKRGLLLLQDGTRLDLDAGEPLVTISRALGLVASLSPTSPEQLPALPAALPKQGPVSPPDAPQQPLSSSPIQHYNGTTNLLDWLVSIGARVASRTRQGGYLLHCPCPNHKHQDTRPSLEIQRARNPRHGAYVAIAHAAGCLFATDRGRVCDAFDAYCQWYGLNAKEALAQLYPRNHA